ncbi:OmpH family outer membrane protein [Membranihabitans maritimus]|uniref:OmpH family outer membrane protein n=1 Tax=Membranihabitans maritimus TaxID=2904244 RepID=UPI001F230D08|nr:OmpH family outer membrane protein [Membranihabitans maritimus]
MKKLFKYFFAVALLASVFQVANAQQKFAYVNSQAILENLPEVKAADAEIQTLQEQLQKKAQEKVQAFRTKMMELQQQRDAGELSPKQLEEESQKLQADETELQQFQGQMQTQIMQKQQSLLQPIQEKIQKAIDDVAVEDGYTFVFDLSTGVLMYADESTNITEKVKAKLSSTGE